MPDSIFEIGLKKCLHIREERISDRQDACRLLYISDVHLRRGRSNRLTDQVVHAARRCTPHVILLGGDLVDSESELTHLTRLTSQLVELSPVFAIGGNHDEAIGINSIRHTVETSGGNWIHDRSVFVQQSPRSIVVSGPNAKTLQSGEIQILCGHNPRIWRRSKHGRFDLVLAGHLHGCQAVAFEFRDRLFPGALFYPYNYLSHQSGSTRLVVSRGVSDLIPIRWRCPREVVLCYV